MKSNKALIQLEKELSLQISNVVPVTLCDTLIRHYEERVGDKDDALVSDSIIKECTPYLSQEPLVSLLNAYFNNGYQVLSSAFDAIRFDDMSYISKTWHLDHGVKRSLKLFIYLNSVAEHQGNTLLIDQNRTGLLRSFGALPLEMDARKDDITAEMRELGISNETLGYDLKAGDVLLFSPFELAHRCLLPRLGKTRYTVCFTLMPT